MGTAAHVASREANDRDAVGRLAEEQAALRRVATLVASGASSTQVFDAVAREVAQVMHSPNAAVCRFDEDGTAMTVLAVSGRHPDDFGPGARRPLDGPSMSATIFRTGRPARIESFSDVPSTLAAEARAAGFNAVAGAPIIVDGRVWGVVTTAWPDAPPADDLEERLAEFTELVATAIANSQANDELERLADEQAALRRVATLVAQGASPAEVFEAVSVEVASLVPAEGSALTRYEADGTVTAVGGWTASGGYTYVGTTYELEGTVSGLVFATGRPARIDSYADGPGAALAAAREMGWRSSVGAPITVEGRLWGVLAVVSKADGSLPADTEARLGKFTELVATAIANAESREERERLAEEQAALRRVATLVAQGALPADVFEAVVWEVGRLVPADAAALGRYEPDGTFAEIGVWNRSDGYVPVGARHAVGTGTLACIVAETRRPARVDDYAEATGPLAASLRAYGWRSAVGAPLIVDGRLWGVVGIASTSDRSLPRGTEARLAEFSELVAIAIGNAESREALTRLAEEQAALRRVATLVARGATPADVFEAVSAEVGRLIPADAAALSRFENDGTTVPVGGWTSDGSSPFHIGERVAIEPGTASWSVLETCRPARVDGYQGVSGRGAEFARAAGWRSVVAAPILVEGRLWGVMIAASTSDEPLPVDTEARLVQFSELLATAIANAESRAQLDHSRARIVATADATRRKIERDLHDGAQQQLISLALQLRAAQAMVPATLAESRGELSQVIEGLNGVLDGLREIALGIHPAILAEGGLEPALKTLARRSPIPVELEVLPSTRLPEPVEVAAYYVVSEALTNAAKYARASLVRVSVQARDGVLRVEVSDDGLGGADPSRGSGLLGLKDRAEAIGGSMSIESHPGVGTSLHVELPLAESAE